MDILSSRCTLMSCQDPTLYPHHHHYVHGDYLLLDTCQCPYIEIQLFKSKENHE